MSTVEAPSIWEQIVQLGQTILVPLVGYAALMLKGVRDEMVRLSDRLLKLEEWRHSHDKVDDERHAQTRNDMDALWEWFRGSGKK